MKKQRFLFALFMAIVMMAFSPGRAWAHYVQVGNNRYELSEISIEGSPGLTATIELNKDDEIEIYFYESLVNRICPEGNNTLTNTGLSCDINYNWPGSITVADAGIYQLTFSEFNYTEVWASYDENDPGTYEVLFAQARLTIMPLDNHVHSYTEEITSEESQKIYPTCTAPGVYYKSCVCGAVSTSEDDTFEIPARRHNFIADHERVVSAATCTEDAYYVGVCRYCQEESNVRDYGSKLGHNWAAAADGVHHTCQRCETQEEHTFDSHTVSESTFISEATCTSAALYHLSCRYCDAISQDNENTFTEGNPLPHTWGDDDKCTMCHNDFNETGDYMNAQVCINDNECLDFSKEDMGTNGKKVHIPEGASISVSLNGYNVYPESDLTIEETSSAVNLSFKETGNTNIYVQNEGDYIIKIRRPYYHEEYNDNDPQPITHASCILCIEHAHAYEVSSCDWSEDNTAATLHLSCSCGSTVELEATVTTAANEGEEPTCTEDGQGTVTASATYDNETFTCSKPVTLSALGHAFSEELSLCDDGYHHYACTREGCETLSDAKYAKMFGEFREVTGDDAPTETIQLTKVGSYYYASLYTDFPYVVIGDVAYYVTSVGDGVVTLGNTANVRAGSGVIFRSENSECTIVYDPEGFENTAPEGNLLTGSDEAFAPNANQYAFGLSDTGYLGFWHWTGMTIPAWSAYLDLGSEPSGARGFRIVFDDEPNGIREIPANSLTSGNSYDLMGRRVSNKFRGITIVDGKKVYVPRK